MQDLQPVGTVEWSDNIGDSFRLMETINEEFGDEFVVNVSYGADYIVYPNDDGDWEFLGEMNKEEDYFWDRTDELVQEQDEFFVVNVPGEDNRYLFQERGD